MGWNRKSSRHSIKAFGAATAVVAATAAVAVASAPARSAAPPKYTSIPTIEGNDATPFVGGALRATTGKWTESPKFTFQWDRCAALGDREGCGPISRATNATYTVQSADVGHTLRVRVTATNKDGSA